MAKPIKTDSGKWTIRVFTGYKYNKDGEKVRNYKRFTADSKKEVNLMAMEYLSKAKAEEISLTLHDAIRKYIDMKEPVLSPTTIRIYENILRQHYSDSFGAMDINEITSRDLQLFVSQLVGKVGAKTTKNTISLAISSIKLFRADFYPRITLPQVPTARTRVPSEEDISTLLKEVRGTALEVAILLGAFVPCRASEISALTADDVEGNVLHIDKAMVYTKDHDWIIKNTPKTSSSNRDVILPDFVLSRLPKEGKLCNLVPNSIPKVLTIKCKQLGIPHFRFHDTRHFAPTIFRSMGLSDKVIMQRGGWETDHVMKSVYMGVLEKDVQAAADMIEERFSYITS